MLRSSTKMEPHEKRGAKNKRSGGILKFANSRRRFVTIGLRYRKLVALVRFPNEPDKDVKWSSLIPN